MNPNHPIEKQRTAVQKQIDHLFHDLTPACRSDYWFTDMVDRLQTSRSILTTALEMERTGKDALALHKAAERRAQHRREALWNQGLTKRIRDYRNGKE